MYNKEKEEILTFKKLELANAFFALQRWLKRLFDCQSNFLPVD